MKLYAVVNYYLVNLDFKFHEDPCINARPKVVNANTPDKTCAQALMIFLVDFFNTLNPIISFWII